MARPVGNKEKKSATKIFVNREKPLELFKKTVAEIPNDNLELLIFYGVGGQGKTSLLKQFELLLKKDPSFSDIHFAVLDLHERWPIDSDLALLLIRNKLAQSRKISFPAFDQAFCAFWKKMYPERQEPELPNNWLQGSIELSPGMILDASLVALEGAIDLAGAPIGGGFVTRLVSYSIKWGNKTWSLKMNEGLKTAFPIGMPDNPAEIEEKLPYLLASDLKRQIEKNNNKRFVIFIDEYERVFNEGGFASRTQGNNRFDKVIRDLVTHLKGTLMVIMSREQLPWGNFVPESVDRSEWSDWIKDCHHSLEGLSPIDAEKFLLAVPVKEEEIRKAIIDASGAKLRDVREKPIYPLLLDLQVDHYVLLKTHLNHRLVPEDFAIQAETFLGKRDYLLGRLLQNYGIPFENILIRLSFARNFNYELFGFLAKEFATGFPLHHFRELTEMSFIEGTDRKRTKNYKIHTSIQEALQERIGQEHAKETHKALVNYYTPYATPIDCKSITEENIDALNELVYHQCCLALDNIVDWWNEFSTPYDNGTIFRQLELSLRLILETVENKKGSDHLDTASSLDNLASNLNAQIKYSRAQTLYERALAIREKVLKPDHPDIAGSLNNLAINLDNQGQYRKAQPLFERALAIHEKDLGTEDPNTAISFNNLASNLNAQGQYRNAQPLFERALAIREKVLEPEHPDIAGSLNNLASNLDAQGQHEKAQSLFERAFAIYEKVLGPEHPYTAMSFDNLASNLNDQGQHGKAQPLYERVLAIREKVLGPEHPDTARSLDNLASILADQQEYGKAQPLFERALTIREKVLPQHPDTARSLNNLALNLENQGDYGRAQSLFERAFAIYETVLGPEHTDTAGSLYNLASNLNVQGEYGRAQPLYERSLAIYEIVLGPEHLETARRINNMALNLDSQGQYGKSQLLYERALAIHEKVLGPEHPDTSRGLNNLALNLNNQGQYGKAQPLYERALAIREKVLGPEHPDTARSLDNLASNLKAQGQYGKAQPLYERALAIREKVLGPEHPDTAMSFNNLASNLNAQGQHGKAQPLFERALAIYEKVLGPKHPDTTRSLKNLASNLCAQGEHEKAQELYKSALVICE